MPNELKSINLSKKPINQSHKKQHSLNSESNFAFMLWSVSGIVLAACQKKPKVFFLSDGSLPDSARGGTLDTTVIDGPVRGARVYADINNDGTPQTDEFIGITNAQGQLKVPARYANTRLIADVTGAIDITTGEALVGQYYSLPNSETEDGIIISPITDLLARSGTTGANTQEMLDQIFGTTTEGESIITPEDILNADNYNPASDEMVAVLVTRAALALTELAEAESEDRDLGTDNANEDSETSALTKVANLFSTFRERIADENENNDELVLDDGGLKTAIDGRLTSNQQMLTEGIPLAVFPNDGDPLPALEHDDDPSNNANEPVYDFADHIANGAGFTDDTLARMLFGFVDTYGNPGGPASQFGGVYINPTASDSSGSPSTVVALHYKDSPTTLSALSAHQVIAGDTIDPAAHAETGFFYVSFANLVNLVVTSDSDINGDFSFQYYVWDGQRVSDSTTPSVLELSIEPVNDIPHSLAVTGDRDTNTGDSITRYVLSSQGRLTLFDDVANTYSNAGVISVEDVETALADFTFTVEGEHGSLFEVNVSDPNAPFLQRRSDATPLIDGAQYSITVVATDEHGGATRLDMVITQGGIFLQPQGEEAVYSNGDGVLYEEFNIQNLGTSASVASASEAGISLTALRSGEAANLLRFVLEVDSAHSVTPAFDSVNINQNSGEITFTFEVHSTTALSAIIEAINTHVGTSGEPSASMLVEADLVTPGTESDAIGSSSATITLSGGAGAAVDIGAFDADGTALNGYDLGVLGLEGGITSLSLPQGISVPLQYYLADAPGNADFRLVMIDGVQHLFYLGEDSGDFDEGESHTVRLGVGSVIAESFTGNQHVDASGDTGDSDLRVFHYSGGAISNLDSVARTVDIAGGMILFNDGTSVSFTGGSGVSFSGNQIVAVYSDGTSWQSGLFTETGDASTAGSFAELQADHANAYYVLGRVAIPMMMMAAVPAVAASGDIGGITFTATAMGVAGNVISVAFEADSNLDGATPLVSVAVTGDAITISYGSGATLENALTQLTASSEASALVSFALANGASNSDTLSDITATTLSGGAEAILAYEATANSGVTLNDGAIIYISSFADGNREKDFIINLKDVDDNDPIFVAPTAASGETIVPGSSPQQYVMERNEDSDDEVFSGVRALFSVSASDADASDTIVYSLSVTDDSGADASALFAIDAQSGAVTQIQALSHEASEFYTLTITATSTSTLPENAGGVPRTTTTTTQVVRLNVADVNEAPTGLSVNQNGAVSESGYRAAATSTDFATEHDFTVSHSNSQNQEPALDQGGAPERISDDEFNDVYNTRSLGPITDVADVDFVGSRPQYHSIILTHDSVTTFGDDVDGSSETDRIAAYNALGQAAKSAFNYRTEQTGTYGGISLHKYSGYWLYTLDNRDADTIALNSGQQVIETFDVLITDEEGLTATDTITITITGEEDAPVLGVGTGLDLFTSEDGDASGSGSFVVSDDDANDAIGFVDGIAFSPAAGNSIMGIHSSDYNPAAGSALVTAFINGSGSDSLNSGAGAAITGTYGTAYLRVDGTWTYTLDNDANTVQALDEGDSVTDTFIFRAIDSDLADNTQIYSNLVRVEITIEGANDTPMDILLDSNVFEGVASVPSGGIMVGSLSTIDIDADDTHSYTLGGRDASEFEIRNDNELWFIGTNGQAGLEWNLLITSTDSQNASRSENFAIAATVLSLAYESDTPPQESADGSTIPVRIGVLSDDLGTAGFITATTDFQIQNRNELYYIGNNIGDFEAGDSHTITVNTEAARILSEFTGRQNLNSDGASPGTDESFHFIGTFSISSGTLALLDTDSNPIPQGQIWINGEDVPISYRIPSIAVVVDSMIWVGFGDHDSNDQTPEEWFLQAGDSLPNEGVYYHLGGVNGDGSALILLGDAATNENVEWRTNTNTIRQYQYEIPLTNINDNPPVFSTTVAGTGGSVALESGNHVITGFNENIVGGSGGVVVAGMRATDADDDAVSFSLIAAAADNDNNLFLFNTTYNELRFLGGQANYERPDGKTDGEYTVVMRATSTSTLPDGGAANTADQTIIIRLNNVNEAPTDIELDTPSISGNRVTTSAVRVIDPDQDGDITQQTGYTFTLVAGTGDADNGLFTINGSNQLEFTGASGTRRSPGEIYSVRVQVADSGGLTYEESFAITEGSVYLAVSGQSRYSEYNDSNGDGLLAENAGATEDIGALMGGAGANTKQYHLMTTADTDGVTLRSTILGSTLGITESRERSKIIADTALFSIDGSGNLDFTGSDSGNLEAGDNFTLLIRVTDLGADDAQGGSGANSDQVSYELYTIELADVNDAPELRGNYSVTIHGIVFTETDPTKTPQEIRLEATSRSSIAEDNGIYRLYMSHVNLPHSRDEIIAAWNNNPVSGSIEASLVESGTGGTIIPLEDFDVNRNFEAPTGEEITITEGGEEILSEAMLLVHDDDEDDNSGGSPLGSFTYRLKAVTNGSLQFNNGGVWQDIGLETTFSLANLRASLIRFNHDGSEQNEISSEGYATSTPTPTTFRLTVNDGEADSAEREYTISVTAVNDAPTLVTNDGATVAEGGTLDIGEAMLKYADVDNTAAQIRYTLTSLPAQGVSVQLNNSNLVLNGTFTQADIAASHVRLVQNGDQATATTSFGFGVDDGAGGVISNLTFEITVSNVNDAPRVDQGIEGQTATEDTQFNFQIPSDAFTDDEGTPLTYRVTGLPAWLSFTTDTFTGTPRNEHGGTAPIITVYANDGTDEGSTTFTITVAAQNDNPAVAVNTGLGVNEDGRVEITETELSVTDEEQGAGDLTYTISGLSNGSIVRIENSVETTVTSFTQADIDSDTIRIYYEHDGSETTSDEFSFSVSDGQSGSTPATGNVSITVTPVNDAPRDGASPLSDQPATEDVLFNFAIPNDAFTDADHDDATLTYTATFTSTWLSFSAGVFSGMPLNEHGGQSVTVTVTATDGGGLTHQQSFNISVTAVNDAPLVDASVVSSRGTTISGAVAGTELSFDLEHATDGTYFTDEESTSLTYSVAIIASSNDGSISETSPATPNWLATDGSDIVIGANSNDAVVGTYTLRVTASDGTLSATQDFSLEVAAPAPSYSVSFQPSSVRAVSENDPTDVANGSIVVTNHGASVNVIQGTYTGTYGTLMLQSTGSYGYFLTANKATLDAADSDGTLNAGESLTDSVTINLDGGGTVDVTFTINGRNDVSGTSGADTLASTSAAELIQGGDGDDAITAGEDDIVVGGAGTDTITLGAGASVMVYRIESTGRATSDTSDDGTTGSDGADVVTGFKIGTDKLVLVDVAASNALSGWDDFITFAKAGASDGTALPTAAQVKLIGTNEFSGIEFVFGAVTYTVNFASAITYASLRDDTFETDDASFADYFVFDTTPPDPTNPTGSYAGSFTNDGLDDISDLLGGEGIISVIASSNLGFDVL